MQTTHTHYRTHTCGDLRMEHVGQTVTLAGFLENVREVGQNFAFAVLRDFYGVTQVVVENEAMWKAFKGLNKESTVQITGVVRERDSKNPKLPTGDIEVVPEAVEVLGRCRHNELPFQINRSREADESARLKYRYLDLRNPEVKNNIILRCQVVAALRKAMLDHGFLEITTPILTASSPEGARDYLVPSRKHPGKFYALPQAPQQFKQLLMASGFDKYFQIAPCFRDEDARGDRSPGEFYQLDMEMAIADQEDVFAVLEDVLPPIFAQYGTYNVASTAPFRRISYRDAMDKYGSDKPDLRIDLTVTDATEALGACGFGPFEGNTVKAVVVTGFEGTRKQVDKLCADVEVQSGEKAYWFRYDENGEIVGGIAKFVQPVKDAVVAALGLEKGCFVGLTAGKLLAAQKAAGVLRSKLGAFCPNHMDKERYEFCWIVDFMYDRRGVRAFGVLPQPLLHAQRRAGDSEKGRRRRGGSPVHHRLSVRSGVQRRGALLRRRAEPRSGDHDRGLPARPPGRGRREGQVPRHVQRLHLRRAPPRGHRPRRGPHGHAAGRRGLHPDHPLPPRTRKRPGSHDGRPFLRHPSPAGRAEHRLHQEGGGRGRRVTAFASFPLVILPVWKPDQTKTRSTPLWCAPACIS